eukprot:g1349.t1
MWLLVLFYLFCAVAILCDKYIVPSIELICDGLNIPDEMACASFLAFGEAAPEIMISVIATAKGKFSMGMGGIIGSAIIAFGLIPSAAAAVAPGGLQLLPGPIIRDTSAFLVALTLLVNTTVNGSINTAESLQFLLLFFVYLFAIFWPKLVALFSYNDQSYGLVNQNETELEESPAMPGGEKSEGSDCEAKEKDCSENTSERLENGRSLNDDGNIDADISVQNSNVASETHFSGGCLSNYLSIACWPIYELFRVTLFDLEEGSKHRHLYGVTFVLSMGYIGLLSHFIIEVVEEIAEGLGMTSVLASVIFIAMGAQVPDTLSAVMLARAGHDDGAISHAISSQVMNIVLGIGGPVALYNVTNGPIEINLAGLHVAVVCVYFLILLYIAIIARSWLQQGEIRLGLQSGAILFSGYFFSIVLISSNECCIQWG